MPILRFADAPEFDLSGIRVRGLASPSRGSTESMTYRLDIAGGQHVPTGVTHASYTREDEEAVILTTMPVGTVTIRPDGKRVSPAWGR
jgi:hypothetical protein